MFLLSSSNDDGGGIYSCFSNMEPVITVCSQEASVRAVLRYRYMERVAGRLSR